MSKASKKWADAVRKLLDKYLEIEFDFIGSPKECRKSGCFGYHPTWTLRVTKDHMYWAHTRSHHALPMRIIWDMESITKLEEVAEMLLRYARKYDPWATYPKLGYALNMNFERETVEVSLTTEESHELQ